MTGGSRGIGRAVALQLAEDGYDVAFCYLQSGAAAEDVAHAVQAFNRRVFHRPCDVTDFSAIQQFVHQAEEALGPLSVVVNSAGIVRDSPLVLMEPESWHAVIATNLDGTYNVCRNVIFGLMKRKSGCIVNLSSVAGVYGNPSQTNYSASKSGIISFSKALAKEVGSFGIRVNVVAPGAIDTEMIRHVDAKQRDRILSAIPLRRLGQACEVAYLVSFLVSDRARYITGQTIQIDGGLSF